MSSELQAGGHTHFHTECHLFPVFSNCQDIFFFFCSSIFARIHYLWLLTFDHQINFS